MFSERSKECFGNPELCLDPCQMSLKVQSPQTKPSDRQSPQTEPMSKRKMGEIAREKNFTNFYTEVHGEMPCNNTERHPFTPPVPSFCQRQNYTGALARLRFNPQGTAPRLEGVARVVQAQTLAVFFPNVLPSLPSFVMMFLRIP